MLCCSDLCTGCGACVNACPHDCIELKFDRNGFLHPEIFKDDCNDCGRCSMVCPELNIVEHNKAFNINCYAGWNNNCEMRRGSSSGGLFSALAEYVITMEGVVCGVALDSVLNPRHVFLDNVKDLSNIRGSKYLQSNTKFSFRKVKQLLDSGKFVLFSGCPCQISGLYSFLGMKHYEKLLTCEVICHGVASSSFFCWYKSKLEAKHGGEIVDVNFRSKKYGWNNSAIEYSFSNGKTIILKSRNDLFMRSYYSLLCIRKCCEKCRYATLPRIADISLGDYWNAVTASFSKKERKSGVSLILINNEKALSTIHKIENIVHIEPITLADATSLNTNITGLGKINKNRDQFMNEYYCSDIDDIMKTHFPTSVKQRIALILGKRNVQRIKRFFSKHP